jgi:hypothetical protein
VRVGVRVMVNRNRRRVSNLKGWEMWRDQKVIKVERRNLRILKDQVKCLN